MSRECLMKRELYATIQRIVEGKEQEPANPPQSLLGSSRGATGKENHNGAGYKQGEGHESNDGDGEGNGVEGNGVEGNGVEGNGVEVNGGEGNGSEGEGSGGESEGNDGAK